jgi:hypothetical protein
LKSWKRSYSPERFRGPEKGSTKPQCCKRECQQPSYDVREGKLIHAGMRSAGKEKKQMAKVYECHPIWIIRKWKIFCAWVRGDRHYDGHKIKEFDK